MDFEERIKKIEINILNDLLKQYVWENNNNLDNHEAKIIAIEKELKARIS